ncbi:MAG TPA: exodeoxyribonuclease V subunit gamma, partial [Candidatus Binataceae bacterium]|nr:exodeoxyribonuclease V subunit gamma [Candidatus Binataceae bacterium]
MICLHYSNWLEELIGPLAASIGSHQRGAPLARAVVVVPNRIVAEFLKLRLAQVLGVAANVEFPFLRRYLAKVVQAADPAAGVLDADELDLVIFECLRAAVESADPDFQAVTDYVSAGSPRPQDRELRLFELSVRTAHLFREYAISRPAMLARWRAGPAPELESMRESERWQRQLYLAIFGAGDRVAPRWITGEQSNRFLLTSALAAVAPGKLRAALATPLHIFGLSYAGPEFARVFARLGALTELHVYALNPCMEFWEDVDSAYAGARDRFVRRGHKVGAALDGVEDPFGLDAAGDNPALRLWGKPGRE